MLKNRRRKRSINIMNLVLMFVAVALVIAIAVGGFFILTNKGSKLPEVLGEHTPTEQEVGSVQLMSEVKKEYAIAVFYPKVDNATINNLIESEAKATFDDLKEKAKAYVPTDKDDQLLYKVDYQTALSNNKYLSYMYRIDRTEKGNVSSSSKSHLYDKSASKELLMDEVFTGQYLKKLEALTKKSFKQEPTTVELASTEHFLTGVSSENEENYQTFFLQGDQLHFYFNPGQLIEEGTEIMENSVSLMDMKRYIGIDILANLPKDESAVQIPDRFIDPDKKMVALTFDDGPHTTNTPKLLECLRENNSAATFFVVGNRIKGNEKIILDIVNSGSEVGSHTYDHADLRKVSDDKLISELTTTNNLVKGSTEDKIETVTLRPPYGAVNANVKKLSPYPMIMWNIDTLDWKTRDAQKTYDSVINHVQDGDIVLMHDIHNQSIDAALRIIPKLVEMGYQLVTIDELFENKGIVLEPGKVYYDALS